LTAAFVVLAASTAALLLVPRHSRPIAVADVGTNAPDFALRDLDGQTLTLSALRGQAIVLYFGSARTAGNSAYDERVNQLARRYSANPRVKFLALDVARIGEERPDAWQLRSDLKDLGRPFPTLLDDRGIVAGRYSVAADESPMIVIIDPRGRVSYRGPFDDHSDIAFATRHYAEDALRETLELPSVGFAASGPR
jgi:peroxiredoxin